jgi:hypothetical protein
VDGGGAGAHLDRTKESSVKLRRSCLSASLIAIALLASAQTAAGSSPTSHATARAGAKLLAHKYLDASRGGHVRARGVKLFVPPGTMERDGLATITWVRRGVYDVHIAAPWHGRVAVTFRNERRARRGQKPALVAHRVAGIWIVERPTSHSRWSRTIWTSTLSPLSPIWNVITKLKIAKCFRKPSNSAKLICIAHSGIEIPLELVHELLKDDQACEQEVLAFAYPAPGGNVLLPPEVQDIKCVQNGDSPRPNAPLPPLAEPLPQLPYQPIEPLKPIEPPRRVIVVDNRVTDGMGMREDTTPARLLTRPWVYCTSRGCNISGTERSSGQTYDAAVCQTFGERTTNGHDTNPSDDANPSRFESTRYYGVRLANGTFGYVSEVWIRGDFRGGLGLPHC